MHSSENQESGQVYLDKSGVTTYLKDAITLMLENRPNNPMEFLAE